jgi:hypothetical protein
MKTLALNFAGKLIISYVKKSYHNFTYQFSKNATNTPDIHTAGVVLGPEEDLRGPIPKGHDFVSVVLVGHDESSSQAKVSQFHDALLHVDQNVLRLHVSVEDPVTVAVFDSL